jgi:predicted ATPase
MLVHLEIKNYKSLAAIVMKPSRFNVLVGPNGAGKSNLIDALSFVQECLMGSVAVPIQKRGGINAVRRKSRGHPTIFGFKLGIDLDDDSHADFAFEITTGMRGFEVRREKCRIQRLFKKDVAYELISGQFIQSVPGLRAKIEPDRLALPILSAAEEFQPLYDYLNKMRFYSYALDQIRGLQNADPGEILKHDGSNSAAVLREIAKKRNEQYERLCSMLSKVVPGLHIAEYASMGQKETIRFKQEVEGDKDPWSFDSVSMSDGTLRVLGILLSVYQVIPPSLIAIEEPEVSIHPAAIEVLVDILKNSSKKTQVFITTHSPDILDSKSVNDSDIFAVESVKGNTIIAPLAPKVRDIIKRKLYLPGELLKTNELIPDIKQAKKASEQLNLFSKRSI